MNNSTFKGVYPILPTPFTETGALDLPSLRRLIEYQRSVGVSGVAILGHMGEAIHLSEAERRSVIETVMAVAKDDLAVWVGVRAYGTMGCVEQAKGAAELGAHCVFVAPVNVQNDDLLYAHYKTVANEISIPVMIHDYPTSFMVNLSPALIGNLAKDGVCPYIKAEDYPVSPKVTAILEASEGKMGIFGGLGGIYYMEELERGAIGIATGFAFPKVLVDIFERFDSGDVEGARAIFDKFTPLIRYEFQPKLGLPFRKHVYQKRGIFDTTVVRAPSLTLDQRTIDEFEGIIQRVGLTL